LSSKCGNDRGDHGKHGQDARRVGLHQLRRPDRQILEYSRLAGDRDDDHHPDEQADGIEVDAGDGLLLSQQAEHDHQHCTKQRDDRAIQPFADDYAIGDDHHHGRQPEAD
jgi:hypothetical protein